MQDFVQSAYLQFYYRSICVLLLLLIVFIIIKRIVLLVLWSNYCLISGRRAHMPSKSQQKNRLHNSLPRDNLHSKPRMVHVRARAHYYCKSWYYDKLLCRVRHTFLSQLLRQQLLALSSRTIVSFQTFCVLQCHLCLTTRDANHL